MSVHSSGSRCLAIGDRERGATVLDPATRELTDPASLEPVTAVRTVRVLPRRGHDARAPACG